MQIRMGDIFIRPKDGHKIEVYKLKQEIQVHKNIIGGKKYIISFKGGYGYNA